MSGIMQAVLASYTVSAAGPTPGSIYFPTTSSRVTLAPGIVVGGTYQSPFTVEGWFYSGDTPGTDSGPVLLSTTTGSATPAYARALTINVVSTTQIVVDSNGAAATTFNLAQTLVADAWYYVAVSRDASGFIQVWLGKQGDASAAASTSGRFDCSANTAAWALDGISDCIGAFVPAGRYSADDNVSGVRVTNTNLYTTTDATIAMPTQTFGYVAGLRFLQSPTDLTDLSGNQTLTSVGSATYSTSGPTISIQTYTGFTTTGLQLYYNPDDRSSYPGTGTTINNLAATSLPGTMSNITYTDPYFTYNGTSSQVSVADTAALEPGSGSWTMEVWVNQTASGTDVVLGKFDPGGLSQDVSYSIRTTGTSYYAQLGSGSGSGSTLFVNSTSFVGTLDTWYQLVYVFTNGGTQTLQTFVNGSSIGTVNHSLASLLNTSTNLYLGSYNNGEYAQWFDGRIGITRLYNTALTSAQVLQNYNANKAVYGL
jgi:hypothetical protein